MILTIKKAKRSLKSFVALFYEGESDKYPRGFYKEIYFGEMEYATYAICTDRKKANLIKQLYLQTYKDEGWDKFENDFTHERTLERYILFEYENINKAIKEYKQKYNLE